MDDLWLIFGDFEIGPARGLALSSYQETKLQARRLVAGETLTGHRLARLPLATQSNLPNPFAGGGSSLFAVNKEVVELRTARLAVQYWLYPPEGHHLDLRDERAGEAFRETVAQSLIRGDKLSLSPRGMLRKLAISKPVSTSLRLAEKQVFLDVLSPVP